MLTVPEIGAHVRSVLTFAWNGRSLSAGIRNLQLNSSRSLLVCSSILLQQSLQCRRSAEAQRAQSAVEGLGRNDAASDEGR